MVVDPSAIFIAPSIHEPALLAGDSYSHFSPIPPSLLPPADSPPGTTGPPCCLGVDEAGRGPVLGPMVYGVFYLPLPLSDPLLRTTHHFDDSKVLTPAVRSALMQTLCTPGSDLHTSCGWAIKALSARDISAGMLRSQSTAVYNLNAQALDATVALIQGVLERGVNVKEIYVDTVGPPAAYQAKLERVFPTIKITVAKKADSLYPCVSAASVCAKVTRDAALEVLWRARGRAAARQQKGGENQDEEEEESMAWGSGYPSDARCVSWLRGNMHPVFGWGPECRMSWGTAKDMLEAAPAKGGGVKVDWPMEEDPETHRVTDFFTAAKPDQEDKTDELGACTPSLRQDQKPPISPEHQQPDPPTVRAPPTAPKALLNLKHIRENPELYAQNARDRNYHAAATYPDRINDLFAQWHAKQHEGRSLRIRSNVIRRILADPDPTHDENGDEEAAKLRTLSRDQLIEEARKIKAELAAIEDAESAISAEMHRLALAIPNLTSDATPRGEEPLVLSYINDHPEPDPSTSDRVWRSHVHIGAELGILDFAGAGTTSGWGWYFLVGEAAQLEHALVSYALAAATRAGWRQVSPPSMVYSHIAAACGFQPRDAHGETQIYTISQPPTDAARGKPEWCLAGTAEIPLAAMKADATIHESELPIRRVAASRCYRAEAGARGSETKGLYRVHEFTKVELFAWTPPDEVATQEVFDEMLDLQTDILGSLGLHCRVLEMPTTDLGASAYRKCDMEAFFPSRRDRNDGWGEVTSASICTDYQTRRLATRLKLSSGGKLDYPWTVNGTALAVPRVLAAILENGWNEAEKTVTIPEVLRPWMDGKEKIGPPEHLKSSP
ncbi:hypothetical protein VTJ49DRAFT_4522 [Mycothermus thermophilus]|uniref:Ribonuclease n=1 Tax=Humicola insolens TaxID=85995 RepID=A0ABR3V551_HUMIN